jgi:MFS family permease
MVEQNGIDFESAKAGIVDFIYSTKNTMSRIILFLAIAGMIVDAWDFSAFSIVSFSYVHTFHPTTAMLGLSVAAVNIGAVFGGVLGGYLTDKLGRKKMFIINMVLFVVMAILSAVSANMQEFIAFRIVLGFALGADVTTGFVYLFEFTERKQRINYSSAWSYIWSIMFLVAILAVFILVSLVGSSVYLWRIIMILGGVFAFIILLLRTLVPESALWFAYRGQFKNAKSVIKKAYGVDLSSVPDVNMSVKRAVGVGDIGRIFKLGYNRYFVHGWSQSILVGFTFWGFSFYAPLLFASLHLSSNIHATLLYDTIIWTAALVGAILSSFLIRVIGIKNVTTSSSLIMAVLFALIYLETQKLLPLSIVLPSAILVNFFLFLGPMSFFTVVNPGVASKYRGIANGWTYTINKSTAVIAGFFGAAIITAIGLSGNTMFLFLLALVAGVISATIGINSLKTDPADVERKLKGRESIK